MDEDKKEAIRTSPVPVIGLSIGIPLIEGRHPQSIKYKINRIKARELFGVGDEDDYEEIDDTVQEDE